MLFIKILVLKAFHYLFSLNRKVRPSNIPIYMEIYTVRRQCPKTVHPAGHQADNIRRDPDYTQY